MKGRPVTPVVLSEEESLELARLVRRRTAGQSIALRARIVQLCAKGLGNKDVAANLATSTQTVSKWRRRFADRRVAGLYDEPRPGGPRTISDAAVEDVIVRTLETTPAHATHWSSRKMERASGVSATSVQRIWRAFGPQPHRS